MCAARFQRALASPRRSGLPLLLDHLVAAAGAMRVRLRKPPTIFQGDAYLKPVCVSIDRRRTRMQHVIAGLRRRAGMRTKSFAARTGRTKLRAREQLRSLTRGEDADRNDAKSFLTEWFLSNPTRRPSDSVSETLSDPHRPQGIVVDRRRAEEIARHRL